MLCSCLPRRKSMCGVNPPRWDIQCRTADGYIEYNICVASRLVIARPLAPKSHAAWKPSVACDVTQILSRGRAPRTMVHAEAQRVSSWTKSGFAGGPGATRPRFTVDRAKPRSFYPATIGENLWLRTQT